MQERLFTIQQVAELLGVTAHQVLQWMRRDWLDSQQLPDGPVRIPERALIGFLEDRGIDLPKLMMTTAAAATRRAANHAADPDQPPDDEQTPPTGDEQAVREMLTGDRPPPPAEDTAPEADTPPEPQEMPVDESAEGERIGGKIDRPEPEPLPAEDSPSPPTADAASQIATAILTDAVALGASHVHVEPRADGLALRLRVNGSLRDKPNFRRRLPDAVAPRLIERLCHWAGADNQDPARPRAGRFTRTLDERPVAFSLSALPTDRGPRLVLAVHDTEVPAPDVAALALPDDARRQIEGILSAGDGGLILVAGATLRARSAALRALAVTARDLGRCVLTAETTPGPLDGVAVSAVDPPAGYRFAVATRALAEQDSDAVLIEQLRDPMTAAVALEMALADRTVLGGIRAVSAAEALALLAEMDIEPWPLAAAMKAVVCARSVRRLCPRCRRAVPTPEPLTTGIALPREALGETVHEPVGCPQCGNTGYAGSLPLTTALASDPALESLVRRRADAATLTAACLAHDGDGLAQLAARYLRDGETSLEEIARVR